MPEASATASSLQAGSITVSARRHRVEGPLFVLLLLCYLWPIDLEPGPNVWAHMDQAAAIVGHGTLSIDHFMSVPEGPNTVDWARAPDGRYYPAKAPGCALAAVPVLGVLYYAESAIGITPLSGEWFRRNTIIVNWAMNSLVSALAMMLLLRIVVSAGIGLAPAVFGVVSIALGTAYHPYATTYYAHNPAANLLVAAAYFFFATAPSPKRDACVGLFAGSAVVFDHAAAMAVLVFAGALAMVRPRSLMAFIAAGLVPLAVLVWYHTTAFGGPAATAYRFMNPKIVPPDGSLLRLPGAESLVGLTISPYRGIFFYSPVLLLAVVGAWCAYRAKQREGGQPGDRPPGSRRREQMIIWSGLLIFALFFLFNASYYIWWGGWTAGSRYVIPGLVLLAPAIALGFRAVPTLGAALLAVSIANHVAIATVWILVPQKVRNPLADAIYPLLWQGDFRRANLGMFLFNLKGLWSLVPLVVAVTCISIALARRIRGADRL